ncbi:MAG TPA: asparagine synthase-related protein [Candidatus Acidoferrales bacterium]|nr:asparagine synthase-related protein [Candidatus Acidoferrales bacterium]
MSGVVGIAYSDGTPVPRELLERMTRSLSFRGPDSQRIWAEGNIGLGHAAQQIQGDETCSAGPETLGDGNWISGDVRLDARQELISELQARGREAHVSSSDSQLLLAAYATWAERCLDHVFGDFAFVLWDSSRKQLFCAGDQFGIRRLYFARLGLLLICSNTLDCVRLHPGVSVKLNDSVVADFLLFGMNQNPSTTIFQDIQRLPRGHYLKWSTRSMEIVEYWRPPVDGLIRYKKDSEYIEHFDDLLRKAIADRTRGKKAGILLSGGLDSSSVTAFCSEERDRKGSPELHAFTVTARDSADGDGSAAETVARALKIPLHKMFADDISLFEGWDSIHWPEPVDDPLAVGMVRQFAKAAKHVPVILSGEGSDNLIEFEPWPHLRNLWQAGHVMGAARAVAEHVLARFQAPDGLRGPLRRIIPWARGHQDRKGQFPGWLNPKFVAALGLKKRWSETNDTIPWNAHPLHARAYASLFFPEWSYMFEREDAAYTKSSVEVRYPFLDLRIIKYLLAIPAMPWFFRKFLLRKAVRGRIPESIRKRPKKSMQTDPLICAAQKKADWLRESNFCRKSKEYVEEEFLADLDWRQGSQAVAAKLRPWCLDLWLQRLGPFE